MQSTATYQTLNYERREIRLLHFADFPGPPDLAVHCEFETVSLNETLPVYIALSYCWGPALKPGDQIIPIFVNDVPFAATFNLSLALYYMRDLLMPLPFRIRVWADAICINQQDAAEKGLQVDLMRQIYGFANGVWCWLLPTPRNMSGSSDAAIAIINEIGLHLHGDRENHETAPLVLEDWLSSQLRNPSRITAWRGIELILNQPYWKRNWIIQEIL